MRLANIWRCFMSYAFSPPDLLTSVKDAHLWALRLVWNLSMCYWCRACPNHRTTDIHTCFNLQDTCWGGPERIGPRPPPWVPLLKGSSILNFHPFRLKNFEHLLGTAWGEPKLKTWLYAPPGRDFSPPLPLWVPSDVMHLHFPRVRSSQ